MKLSLIKIFKTISIGKHAQLAQIKTTWVLFVHLSFGHLIAQYQSCSKFYQVSFFYEIFSHLNNSIRTDIENLSIVVDSHHTSEWQKEKKSVKKCEIFICYTLKRVQVYILFATIQFTFNVNNVKIVDLGSSAIFHCKTGQLACCFISHVRIWTRIKWQSHTVI